MVRLRGGWRAGREQGVGKPVRGQKEKKNSHMETLGGGGEEKVESGRNREIERERSPADEIHLHKNPILLLCNMLQMDGLT